MGLDVAHIAISKMSALLQPDLERLEAVTLAHHTPYFHGWDLGESSWQVGLCDVRPR
jgi:hypothetical protein